MVPTTNLEQYERIHEKYQGSSKCAGTNIENALIVDDLKYNDLPVFVNEKLSNNTICPSVDSQKEGELREKTIKKAAQNKKRDVLEVEDDEQRIVRLQSLLESMNAESSSSTLSQLASSSTQSPFSQFPPSKPHSVPKSELLSRLESFLPQLAQSNADLLQQAQSDPTSVNIEDVSEDQETYIEMNLGLGVFEQRKQKTDTANSDDSSDSDSNADHVETRSSDSSASISTPSSVSGTDSDSSKASSDASSSSEEEAP